MNKHFLPNTSVLVFCYTLMSGAAYAGASFAPSLAAEDDQVDALQKTLEHNFSPEDRARLRKALSDFSKNTDPEHVRIEKKREVMQANLKQRFSRCDSDVDDALSRQESTECLPQVARHFNFVDVDEDNVITFEELELAQAKWVERRKAADAKVEAERLKKLEATLKKNGKRKIKKQASSAHNHPS